MIAEKPEGWTAQDAEMSDVLGEAKILKEREILEMYESILRFELNEDERCRCPECRCLLAYNPNTRSYICVNRDCSLFHYRKGEKG